MKLAGNTEPQSKEQERLWLDAEAVWARYADLLEQRDGNAAAELTSEKGLECFRRYREAALSLRREQLLRLRPQEVVHVLQLRALSDNLELSAMNNRDIFILLAGAGALKWWGPQAIKIAYQYEDSLFQKLGERWPTMPLLSATPQGPRVMTSNALAMGRWDFRRRLGIDWTHEVRATAEALLQEAARVLGRAPDEGWWVPRDPISSADYAEAREKLESNGEGAPGSDAPSTGSGNATKRVEPRIAATAIRDTVRHHFPAFATCYEDGMARNPHLEGRVLVSFVISRSGRVPEERHSGDLRDEDVADCVAAQFLTLRFPEPDGGVVQVTYPIMFSPG